MSIANNLFITIIGFYLLFGYAAQIVTISGVPLGEAAILLVLATLLISAARLIVAKKVLSIVVLASVISLCSILRAGLQATEYGIFAIRDATHFIDMLSLVAVYFGSKNLTQEKSLRLYNTLLFLACVYLFMYFVRSVAPAVIPKISNPHGGSVSLLSYIAFPTLFISLAFSVFSAKSYSQFKRHRTPIVFTILLLLMLVIQIFQARLIYIQLVASLCIYVFLKPKTTKLLPLYLIFALFFLLALAPIGAEFGRLKLSLDLDNLTSHLYSIFGVDRSAEFSGAASGVDLRFGWWENLYEKVTENFITILFGLGFGLPLTDFVISGGIVVREVHNSSISILGRQGIVGFLSVLVLWYWLCKVVVFHLKRAKRGGQHPLVLFGCYYLINVWIFSLAEDAFEKPCFAIPFYGIAGYLLIEFARAKKLQNAELCGNTNDIAKNTA